MVNSGPMGPYLRTSIAKLCCITLTLNPKRKARTIKTNPTRNRNIRKVSIRNLLGQLTADIKQNKVNLKIVTRFNARLIMQKLRLSEISAPKGLDKALDDFREVEWKKAKQSLRRVTKQLSALQGKFQQFSRRVVIPVMLVGFTLGQFVLFEKWFYEVLAAFVGPIVGILVFLAGIGIGLFFSNSTPKNKDGSDDMRYNSNSHKGPSGDGEGMGGFVAFFLLVAGSIWIANETSNFFLRTPESSFFQMILEVADLVILTLVIFCLVLTIYIELTLWNIAHPRHGAAHKHELTRQQRQNNFMLDVFYLGLHPFIHIFWIVQYLSKKFEYSSLRVIPLGLNDSQS